MDAGNEKKRPTNTGRIAGSGLYGNWYEYIDSAAVTRNMWMYNTLHDLKIDSVHFIKAKATTVDDVGIVKAHFYWSGSYDEERFSDSTSFVDTWIKRYSGWQVVSRIITD